MVHLSSILGVLSPNFIPLLLLNSVNHGEFCRVLASSSPCDKSNKLTINLGVLEVSGGDFVVE